MSKELFKHEHPSSYSTAETDDGYMDSSIIDHASSIAVPMHSQPSLRDRFIQETSISSRQPNVHIEKELDYHDIDHSKAHGYDDEQNTVAPKKFTRSRTLSVSDKSIGLNHMKFPSNESLESITEENDIKRAHRRRGSHDEHLSGQSRKFLIDVPETQRMILEQEDTDGDFQITIHDHGPKSITLGTVNSSGYKKYEVRGTYMLSNLLQELALANDYGRRYIVLDEERLNENPVDRLSRLIKYHFWDNLTRRIDANGLEIICNDPKNRSIDQQHRIYVPYHDSSAYEYYVDVAKTKSHLNLDVVKLPEIITPEYVKSLNNHPGILSLALRTSIDVATNETHILGTPFVVPGGRFNEMYGWDSYFETLGLIVDGRVELARGMVENFSYEIEHYGKILNANRSYYLSRSQPPFLTDMINVVYGPLCNKNSNREFQISWLAQSYRAAIRELLSIWLSSPRLDPTIGLCKYHAEGVGIPPETEVSHFDAILQPYADKYNISIPEFIEKYDEKVILEPELDSYFIHDRAVRESGHDTSYRLEGRCADLATVDLNSLVYRYQVDIADIIRREFNGIFKLRVRCGPKNIHLNKFLEWIKLLEEKGVDGCVGNNGGWNTAWASGIIVFDQISLDDVVEPKQDKFGFKGIVPSYEYTSDGDSFLVYFYPELFEFLSRRQRHLIDLYLWNGEKCLYFDYDCNRMERSDYESVTSVWTMWAGCASVDQAAAMVPKFCEKFETIGGLVCGTEESRGPVGIDRPNRQWDYPYGWAPHQILAWSAMYRYGYADVARRFAYRWLYTITKSFVDFNGVVPEKFNVVDMTHIMTVEYGNVGVDFKMVVREGFGWMNASYQVGLTYMTKNMRRALGTLTSPSQFFTVEGVPKKGQILTEQVIAEERKEMAVTTTDIDGNVPNEAIKSA